MALLYYWQPDNYTRDARFGFGYHLSQGNPLLATLAVGDSVWAFTRRRDDKMYVLAAELVVAACTRNPPNYRYGAFRVWGNLRLSRYFDITRAPNAETLIRSLTVSTNAAILAQSFQGYRAVKKLSSEDAQLLRKFSTTLPVLPHIALYPEDELEARLLFGDDLEIVPNVDENDPLYTKRHHYLYETLQRTRARSLARELQRRYEGRCQICGFDPIARYNHYLCHGHHIIWLCRGGDDDLENMMLVCPTHHTAIHQADAIFDYSDLTYRFQNGLTEGLQINQHLPVATLRR